MENSNQPRRPHNPFRDFINNSLRNLPPAESPDSEEPDEGYAAPADEASALQSAVEDFFGGPVVYGDGFISITPDGRNSAPGQPISLTPNTEVEQNFIDNAQEYLDWDLSAEQITRLLRAFRAGTGLEETEAMEREGSEPEAGTQPTLEQRFGEIQYTSEVDRMFGEFMDGLPDPNQTNIWQSKFTDPELQFRGLMTSEIYQNFVEQGMSDLAPKATDYATMEAYRAAEQRHRVRMKYLLSFSVSLAMLAYKSLHEQLGDE